MDTYGAPTAEDAGDNKLEPTEDKPAEAEKDPLKAAAAHVVELKIAGSELAGLFNDVKIRNHISERYRGFSRAGLLEGLNRAATPEALAACLVKAEKFDTMAEACKGAVSEADWTNFETHMKAALLKAYQQEVEMHVYRLKREDR